VLTRLLGAFLLTVVSGACGESASSPIGQSCIRGESCPLSGTSACITTWPGGYCTEFDCQPGSCPLQARCVSGFTFGNAPFDAFCMRSCETSSDCRSQYRCAEIDSDDSVCVPVML
jgi:hypothetical protein